MKGAELNEATAANNIESTHSTQHSLNLNELQCELSEIQLNAFKGANSINPFISWNVMELMNRGYYNSNYMTIIYKYKFML